MLAQQRSKRLPVRKKQKDIHAQRQSRPSDAHGIQEQVKKKGIQHDRKKDNQGQRLIPFRKAQHSDQDFHDGHNRKEISTGSKRPKKDARWLGHGGQGHEANELIESKNHEHQAQKNAHCGLCLFHVLKTTASPTVEP